VKPLKATIL